MMFANEKKSHESTQNIILAAQNERLFFGVQPLTKSGYCFSEYIGLTAAFNNSIHHNCICNNKS